MAVRTDKNGLNIKIKSTILNDEEMRRIGFTDYDEENWYYCRHLPAQKKGGYKGLDVSFNVSIPKNGKRLSIDVLDEDFLQPYDYQSMLERPNPPQIAYAVRDFVEKQMSLLQKSGVISGHIKGEYI